MKRLISVFLALLLISAVPVSAASEMQGITHDAQLTYEECFAQVHMAEAQASFKAEQERGLLMANPPFNATLLTAVKNAMSAQQSSVSISSYGINKSRVGELMQAVYEKYPIEYTAAKLYYYGYSYNGSGIISSVRLYYYEDDGTTYQERYTALSTAINDVTQNLSDSATDFEKVLAVHDYLVYNCEYDLSYSIYDAYTILVEKTGVCQAYSEAFDLLMLILDVECVVVSSTEMNHAWNLVYLDGSWYHVDATWDDPIPDTPGEVRYTYFLHDDSSFEGSYEHYAWDASGLICTNSEYENLPRGTNATQVYKNGYWYYVKDKGLWRCDYDGDNPVCLMSSGINCVAVYDGRIFLGKGKNIVEYDPGTGEEELLYTMAEEESGDWPNESSVGIRSINISSDGILSYTCFVWQESSNSGYYYGKEIDGLYAIIVTDGPAAVTDLTVTATGCYTIDISWSASKNAEGYELYRSTSENGEYTLIYQGTSRAYTDSGLTPKTTYYYGVLPYFTRYGVKIYSDDSEIQSATTSDTVITGKCGNNLTWTLDLIGGTLDISGTGDMYDYSVSSPAPWYNYRSNISSVSVGNGATSIGDYAFRNCTAIDDAFISYTVTAMGNNVFDNAPSGLTVSTYFDTTAHEYCKTQAIDYILVDELVDASTKIRIRNNNRLLFPSNISIVALQLDASLSGNQAAEAINAPKALYHIGLSAPFSTSAYTVLIPTPQDMTALNCTVYLLGQNGGLTALETSVEGDFLRVSVTSLGDFLVVEDGETSIERINGNSRVDTALKIGEEGWNGNAQTVLLANGYSFADALAGGPLSYALDAPILLTANRLELELDVIIKLEEMGTQNVIILGGEGAVRSEIEDKLIDLGYNVERIFGTSRFDTAVKIAQRLEAETGAGIENVFVAYSHNYPDALAVSSVASVSGSPILFVKADGSFDAATAEYITACGTDSAVILGGYGAVGEGAEGNLAAMSVADVRRIFGTTRYDTALKISKTYKHLFAESGVVIATGQAFPDALAGGAFAAKKNMPVILINPSRVLDNVADFIGELAPNTVYVLGGEGAVPDLAVTGYLRLN